MKILVTGGAGFIGSNYVRNRLQNHPDDKLVVYDKLTYAGNLANLKSLENKPNYTFVKADITDYEALEKAILTHEIDTIVHFAAETHVDRSIKDADDFIQTNIVGTYTILELLKKYPQIRLHHVSTDEVFGDLPLDDPSQKFSEDSPYEPSSPYSASKAAADHLVRAYSRTYGIKATLSNCSNNFGPFCHVEKFIPKTITKALNDEKIPIYGTGKQVRDWIYVLDHAKGIDTILEKGKSGETYLLGGNGERDNLTVVRAILKYLNKPDSLIEYVEDRKGHDQRYAIDFSKAKKELGFEPEKNFEKRLAETIDWYVENKDWWEV